MWYIEKIIIIKELDNMLSFSEFIQLKNKDINGSDIRKSEYAGIRAILETVKENYRFIVDNEKKKIIEEFVKRITENKNGSSVRSKKVEK